MDKITILWPCDRGRVYISSNYQQHLDRPGYTGQPGTDLAGQEQPLRPSQFGGKVTQATTSKSGYGVTTFVDYFGVMRVRNAHQKNLGVKVGDIVNPGDYLGTMDSTGNSSGTHTHWEVWLKRGGIWRNVDPLDPANNLQIVNDPALLVPIDGEEIPMPPTVFVPPPVPEDLTMVKPTAIISHYSWWNLRSRPAANTASLIVGRVNPDTEWAYWGYEIDVQGNYWYSIRRGSVVGWVAAYYNGQPRMELVTA